MTRPLRVMIDARMLIGPFAGVSRHVTSLVDELAGQEGLQIVALCGSEAHPVWLHRGDVEVVASDFDRDRRTVVRRVIWEETRLPRYIRKAGVDLYHATWNTGVPARCPVPSVLTVHDLIPFHDPKTHFPSTLHRAFHRYAVRSSARRAARIVTVSHHVRADVLDRLNVPAERVVVVHNGVNVPQGRCPERSATSPPYVLYVGGYEPRKNVAAVFGAVNRYWQRFGGGLELRLTGDQSRLTPDGADALGRVRANGPIRFLGTIGDGELNKQYESAQLLLMLSHDEGFGLPALEAMAHGCPVVASADPALAEVVNGAGVVVDAQDTEATAGAMRRLITDSAYRAECVRQGARRAEAFTWSAAATHLRRVYESVAREQSGP